MIFLLRIFWLAEPRVSPSATQGGERDLAIRAVNSHFHLSVWLMLLIRNEQRKINMPQSFCGKMSPASSVMQITPLATSLPDWLVQVFPSLPEARQPGNHQLSGAGRKSKVAIFPHGPAQVVCMVPGALSPGESLTLNYVKLHIIGLMDSTALCAETALRPQNSDLSQAIAQHNLR